MQNYLNTFRLSWVPYPLLGYLSWVLTRISWYFCRVLILASINIHDLLIIFVILHKTQRSFIMSKEDINRLKVVLVEKKRTAKWLAEKINRDPATVSKWCTNTVQPTLDTLRQVADLLDVDIKELLNSSK